jgi:hypothetical protein
MTDNEPDRRSALRWTVVAIILAESAGFGFLIATAKDASPELDFMRVGLAFFMGVLVMAWPLLWFMGEGRDIARYCLDHHCGREEEPE